jgi:hypothetical protein
MAMLDDPQEELLHMLYDECVNATDLVGCMNDTYYCIACLVCMANMWHPLREMTVLCGGHFARNV